MLTFQSSPSPQQDAILAALDIGGPLGALWLLIGAGLLGLFLFGRQQRKSAAEAREDEDHLRALADLGTMSVGFVHDLNNQLMVLVGSLEHARSSQDLSPAAGHRLEQAETAASSIGELAGRMLRLARNDPFVTQEVVLDPLLKRVMSNLNSIGGEGVELRLRAEHCPKSLMGDATLLESALTNLGKNSLEALAGDGLLEIRTIVRNDQLTIVVEDNGPGIQADQLDDLFVPFRTAHSNHGGTGLGLYMAKAAVEAHGGSISVETAPTQGARFSVRLPLQTAAAA